MDLKIVVFGKWFLLNFTKKKNIFTVDVYF